MAFFDQVPVFDVVDDGAGCGEVQRDRGELRRGAALQEQHLVVGRDGHQLAQVALRPAAATPTKALPRWLISMTDMPLAVPVEHLVAELLEHFDGQRGGTGAEIEHTGHDGTLRKGFSHRSLAGATRTESVNAASAHAAA